MAKPYVVGIGASAGGLEALKPLLKNLQKTTRFVFIIAQHMHSDAHTELMAKLLAVESKLPVTIVKDSELLQPDRIYLIPAGYDGYVNSGKLHLAPPVKSSSAKPSINILLNSIATEYNNHSVAIILSGVGSDGAKGCLTIKSKGGLTIAQHPANAKFDGMPREAINLGAVQYVMAPEKMGMFLESFQQNSRVTALQGRAQVLTLDDKQLTIITQMILDDTGVDFSQYKPETITRRINARMAYLGVESVDAYMKYCANHRDEIQSLQQTLLISNSHFFRDPAAFQALQQILLEWINKKTSADTIRIFVPACASGEECYSLAIIFNEIFNHIQNPPSLQIMGRDLNINAIRKAREGWYLPSALKQMDSELLERYFVKELNGYRVNNQLRNYCRFELEDIFNANMKNQFDIISCRNFLIYLQPDLQNSLLKKFHKLLNNNGFLFLGQSENMSEFIGRNFLPLSYIHKIFKHK